MPSEFKMPEGEKINNDRPNRRKAKGINPRIGGKFDEERKAAFLDVVAETGNMSEACREVNINPRTYRDHRKVDPEFAEALELARAKGLAVVEKEMRRRGIQGYKEEVYQGGELVGHVTRYSDKCILALARAADPQRYGTHEIAGGGGNIIVQINQAFERLPDGSVAPVVVRAQVPQIEHNPTEVDD